jgi:hypothetical protein
MPLLDEAAEYIESLSGYARAKAAGLKVGAYWHDEKTGEDILLDNRVAEGIESLQAELAEARKTITRLEGQIAKLRRARR